MKTSLSKLRAAIKTKGLNAKDCALLLGMSRSAFYRRVHTGGLSFTIAEVHRLADVLELTGSELAEIFFVE